MKKSNFKYLFFLAAFVLVYACKKETGVTNQPYTAYGNTATQGQLKIIPEFTYNVNLFNLLLKVNGNVVSNTIATRTPFPGGGYNTNGSNFALYLGVPLGSNTVSVIVPKFGTNMDSIVLFNNTITIPDNGAYSLHIADTLVNPTVNNTKGILVKNHIADLDTGYCRFRFVNMIPNLPAVDVYLNGILMKSNVAFMATSDTFTVRTGVYAPGYNSAVTTTWAIRPAGAAATSTATCSYASSNGLLSQRVMTVFGMGYAGLTGGRLPYVALTLDKNQ